MIFFAPIFLSNNRNFRFYPTIQANQTLYAHIFNHTTTKILISNTFNFLLCILRHQKLSYMVNICSNHRFPVESWAIFNLAAFWIIVQLSFDLHATVALALTNAFIETKFDNSMRIYGDVIAIKEIFQLVAEKPFIWEFQGFFRIFSKC